MFLQRVRIALQEHVGEPGSWRTPCVQSLGTLHLLRACGFLDGSSARNALKIVLYQAADTAKLGCSDLHKACW